MVLRCVENSSARIAHVYNACGGEGGIRTLGTLIRGTHDFQSCTFNRSVTSPVCNFRNLRALPCSTDRQCLHRVLPSHASQRFITRQTELPDSRSSKLNSNGILLWFQSVRLSARRDPTRWRPSDPKNGARQNRMDSGERLAAEGRILTRVRRKALGLWRW
jgi:hypothetical protein